MYTNTLRLMLACIALLFYATNANAQYSNYKPPMQDTRGSSALNFYVGSNTFLGDLGGTKGMGKPYAKDFNIETLRPFFGISYAYFPYSWLSVKGGFHYTWITGADSLIAIKQGNAAGRFERNLHFKSAVSELSAEVELYPLQTLGNYEEGKWRPFFGTGIGALRFNPKAQLKGEWISLKPLHLEGQSFAEYPERKEYKRTQLYIPLTVGLKYRINNNYFISLSSTVRRTFTDYLDDVSTTFIDPNLFDKYLTPEKAILAKQLYYRGTVSEVSTPGPYRGYASNDSYTSVFITVTYLFDRRDFLGFNRPY